MSNCPVTAVTTASKTAKMEPFTFSACNKLVYCPVINGFMVEVPICIKLLPIKGH